MLVKNTEQGGRVRLPLHRQTLAAPAEWMLQAQRPQRQQGPGPV